MPVTVEKLPNEPIIILHYKGMLSVEDIQKAFSESRELMQKHQLKQTYRISYMLDAEYPNFGELRRLFTWIGKKQEGSSADYRIHGVFVGNNAIIRAYTTFIRTITMNTRIVPSFNTLEEALAYLRTDPKKIAHLGS